MKAESQCSFSKFIDSAFFAQHGFTLVELLVVMAILGVLVSTLYTTFRGGTNAWVAGDARVQRGQNSRAVLEIMSRDLKQAFTKSATNLQFQGSNSSWTDGATVRAADTIYFTSASNDPNDSGEYDLREVGYYLVTSARAIYRLEDDSIDSDLTGGIGSSVTEFTTHVIGLNLRYYDGATWSSDGTYAKSAALPKAVEITLTVEDEDQVENPRDFRSIVYIP